MVFFWEYVAFSFSISHRIHLTLSINLTKVECFHTLNINKELSFHYKELSFHYNELLKELIELGRARGAVNVMNRGKREGWTSSENRQNENDNNAEWGNF